MITPLTKTAKYYPFQYGSMNYDSLIELHASRWHDHLVLSRLRSSCWPGISPVHLRAPDRPKASIVVASRFASFKLKPYCEIQLASCV